MMVEFLQNMRQNLFNTSANQPQDQNRSFIQRIQDPKFLGLLAGAAATQRLGAAQGLLEGARVRQSFQQVEEDRKRKEMLQKLISEGGFTKQEQYAIAASDNPAGTAVQIRNQKQARLDAAAARKANRKPTLQEQIDERFAVGQAQGLTGEKLQIYAMTGNVPASKNKISKTDEEILDLSVKLKIPIEQASKMYFEKQGYQIPGSKPKTRFNMPEQIYNDLPAASKTIVANLGIQGILYGTDEFSKRFASLTAPQEQNGFRFASPTEIAAFRSAGGLSDDAPLGGVLYINTKDNSPKFIKTDSTAPVVNVNTGSGSSAFIKKYQEERAKVLAAEQNISDEFQAIATFNALEKLVTDEDFYSGTGGELVLQAKQLLVSLGIADEDMTASSEAFRAQTRKAALDGIGGSLGVGFSNADRDFIVEQNPSLSNTPSGNLALIKLNRNIQQRRIDIANEISRYLAENNYEESGLNRHLTKWAEEQPLISKGIFENELNINFGDVVYPQDGDFSGFTFLMLNAIDQTKLSEEQIKKLIKAYRMLEE